MILTPEEQLEYREEIDYLIEIHGYEYIWGKETAMDKTKGLLRDAPSKIIEGINKIATNPNVIEINEKLKAHAERMNAQEGGVDNRQTRRQPKQKSRKQSDTLGGGFSNGFDFGDDHL